MNICSQIESDSFLPSSTASSSSLILTTQSKSSPQFTQTHQTFFQTIKKDNRSQNKKRRYLFETSNIPECKSDQCDQVSKKQSNCFLNKSSCHKKYIFYKNTKNPTQKQMIISNYLYQKIYI